MSNTNKSHAQTTGEVYNKWIKGDSISDKDLAIALKETERVLAVTVAIGSEFLLATRQLRHFRDALSQYKFWRDRMKKEGVHHVEVDQKTLRSKTNTTRS